MKKYNRVLPVDDDLVSCFICNKILRVLVPAENTHTAHKGNEGLDFIGTSCNEIGFSGFDFSGLS